jgi:hypothetical protein
VNVHNDNERRKKKRRTAAAASSAAEVDGDGQIPQERPSNRNLNEFSFQNQRQNQNQHVQLPAIDLPPVADDIAKLKIKLGIEGQVSALADLGAFQSQSGIFARFKSMVDIETEYQNRLKYISSLTSKTFHELEQQTEFCFMIRTANVLQHSRDLQDNLDKQYHVAKHAMISMPTDNATIAVAS